MVRRFSAKELYAGSIPAVASKAQYARVAELAIREGLTPYHVGYGVPRIPRGSG